MRFIGDNIHGDAVSSRTIMITKNTFKYMISNKFIYIVYPCIEANGLPGSNNVIRDRPLYDLSMLQTSGTVEKSNLDDLINLDGNLFLLLRYAHESFVSIASDKILNEENLDEKGQFTWSGGLHCGMAEPVKLFFAVLINYNASGIHKKVRKSKKRRKRVSIVKKQKSKQKSKKQKSKN